MTVAELRSLAEFLASPLIDNNSKAERFTESVGRYQAIIDAFIAQSRNSK